MGFSEHREALFSSRLLALDIEVENMDFSSMWKYTRQNIRALDKEVVGVLRYNSIKSDLMKGIFTAKKEGKCQLLQHVGKQMKVIEPLKTGNK
jgi:hypothetical protein